MSQTHRTSTRPSTISTPAPAAHDTELVDSMDELLDAIDAVLEDQEHLVRFRQKGGQ